MLEKEWDEAPEKKISFGDKVDTPDGIGTVTELDFSEGQSYFVIFPDSTSAWYLDEEIVIARV